MGQPLGRGSSPIKCCQKPINCGNCHNIYTTHCACYLQIANIWSLSLLCAFHMVQCIFYCRSEPKQVLLEAVELVDMEREMELELEKELEVDLELVVCRTFDC